MIDVRLLRTDPDGTRARLARRGQSWITDAVDKAIALDERLREIIAERDELRHQVNDLSKQIGLLRRDGDVAAAEPLQAQSRELGEREAVLATEHDVVQSELHAELLEIPNIPADGVPDGASEDDNPVVVGPFMPNAFPEHQRVPHWETATALGILDNERATKIAQSMFTMQRGAGAALGRALCQLALDRNADIYEEIRAPSLVSTDTLTSSGHLPKFADDAFAIERDDLWCIPTAEVPLTSMYGGEILEATQLPMRFIAYSPSYRREAGSAGRDTRGMLRSHEFDKVELLSLGTPAQARDLMIEIRDRAEALISDLGLPYRIIAICSGDLGAAHHESFDIEVYGPGVDTWLEVSSVSWYSDYQARRASLRYRPVDDEGRPQKGTEMLHTVNGSGLAVPRVWAAIIENYRNEDGSVSIPEILLPYMRGLTRIEARA